MKRTIELSYEAVDEIVISVLKESYYLIKGQIEELESKIHKLKDFQIQDLSAHMRDLSAHEILIEYYGGNLK